MQDKDQNGNEVDELLQQMQKKIQKQNLIKKQLQQKIQKEKESTQQIIEQKNVINIDIDENMHQNVKKQNHTKNQNENSKYSKFNQKKRDFSQEKNKNQLSFKDYKFFIIEDSCGIGKKACNIIIDNIQTRDGKAYRLDQFYIGNSQTQRANEKIFYLTQPHINPNYIQKQFQNVGLQLQDAIDQLIDSNFVSECIQQNQLLNINKYKLNFIFGDGKSQQTVELQNEQIATIKQSQQQNISKINEQENIVQLSNQDTKEMSQKNIQNTELEEQIDETISDEEHYNLKQYYEPNFDDQTKNDYQNNATINSDESDIQILETGFPHKKVLIEQNDEEQEEDLLKGINKEDQSKIILNDGIHHQNQQVIQGLKRKAKYWDNKQSNFAFSQEQQKINQNSQITNELQKLLDVYTYEKDYGRQLAYKKALQIIKNLPFQVTQISQLANRQGLGKSLLDKIQEILQSGKLRKAENLCSTEKYQCIKDLSQVWGIGPTTANKLYSKGIKSINDLRKNQDLLTEQQIIGLKYHEEILQRMPREEVAQISQIVEEAINELCHQDNSIYNVTTCGSYRRGKETCGDVDIIICKKDGMNDMSFLPKLIQKLTFEKKLLKDHLTLPSGNSTHGCESYMGICKLNSSMTHRRIDIKQYPAEQYGFALLYFTGSDHFNRSMRLFARKKGYSLSDHDLVPVQRLPGQKKIKIGQGIQCFTEEDIFKALNIQFIAPNKREI